MPQTFRRANLEIGDLLSVQQVAALLRRHSDDVVVAVVASLRCLGL
jgi:hypothetical protein